MDILIPLLLIAAGICLFMVEVFITPGISVAGISAGICFIYAVWHAFTHTGPIAGFASIAIVAIGCIAVIIAFMRSKTLDRLSLKKEINSSAGNHAATLVKPGDEGTATTRLALVGNAYINGHVIEVKSAEGLIDEGTAVTVWRIDQGTVIVKRAARPQ